MRVVVSRSANRELTGIYATLELAAGSVTADRFLDEVDAAIDRLRLFPFSGSPRPSQDGALRDVRVVRVVGFGSWIYYRPAEKKLKILRVLKSGVDLNTLLTPSD